MTASATVGFGSRRASPNEETGSSACRPKSFSTWPRRSREPSDQPATMTRLPCACKRLDMLGRGAEDIGALVGALGREIAAELAAAIDDERLAAFRRRKGRDARDAVRRQLPSPFLRRQIKRVGRQRLIERIGRDRHRARFCARRNNRGSARGARPPPPRPADRAPAARAPT